MRKETLMPAKTIKPAFHLLGLLLLGSILLAGQPQQKDTNNGGKKDVVTVEGCPARGVEQGCLMLVTPDGKTTYNISAANPKPKVGDRAVRLTGTRTDKASFCMQGVILENIKWNYLEAKCPAPSDKPKK